MPHSGIRRNRPPGSSGQPILVTTNSFPVTSIPNGNFFHYDAFKEPFNRRRSLEIIDKLQMQHADIFNPRATYDGKKNMFRSKALKLAAVNAATFTVYMGDNPEEARRRGAKGIAVKIALVAQIDTGSIRSVLKGQPHTSASLTTMTLLNILVRMQPILMYPSNSHSFFTKEGRDPGLGRGLELWRGYFQSVRPSIDRITVNVDITSAVMYQGGPLPALVMAFLGIRDNKDLRPDRLDERQIRQLESFLKGLLVFSNVPRPAHGKQPRLRPIRHVVRIGANRYRFDKEGKGPNEPKEEMTITEYFKNYYNYNVMYGDIICVGFSRGIVYPIEMLEVKEGQIYKKTLPPSLAPRALKFATQRPHDRLQAIEASRGLLGYNDSDFLRHSGMEIGTQPMRVPARVLTPPLIQFGGGQRPDAPMNGSWNVVGRRLLDPAKVPAWAVIVYDPHLTHSLGVVQNFVGMLIEVCKRLGMLFPNSMPPIIPGNPQGNLQFIQQQMDGAGLKAKATFEHETGANRPAFILVILPDSAMDIRTAVKNWGDCGNRGCPTQCMKAGKLRTANDQYCNNMALKINTKIGGVNSVPSANVEAMKWLASAPTMIVGADVSHASPDSQRPSITGLVSSVDEHAVRYVASTGMQAYRTEIIEDLDSMIENAVRNFNEYQKGVHRRDIYPQRIVFYRDGVSEGQFDAVAVHEVAKVKKILSKLGIRAKLTFIVVGKRHHVRFFPKRENADPKSGNCPAGTVVDQGIVHPVEYDFYLQSHGGLLGTSRPSHYTVLTDENALGADPLQELSYTLCHVYARATRSVSIPAPVYYADIVCARGRFHSPLIHDEGDGSTVVSGQEVSLQEHRQNFKPVTPSMAQTMYFM